MCNFAYNVKKNRYLCIVERQMQASKLQGTLQGEPTHILIRPVVRIPTHTTHRPNKVGKFFHRGKDFR